jgi:DNA-binding transcriptional MerR regulator
MATLAGISEQTVRNFTRTYAELLSPAGRGEMGARAFSDEDTQVLLSVATMRRAGVPPAEIIERIKRGDVYIEPQQTTTTSPQATPSPQEGPQAPQHLMMVLSSHEAQFVQLRREIEALRTRQATGLSLFLTGIIVGMLGFALAAALWTYVMG